MTRHIETKSGLKILLKRMEELNQQSRVDLEDYEYWHTCVAQCIEEELAMDETDYENAPAWFKPLWRGLK